MSDQPDNPDNDPDSVDEDDGPTLEASSEMEAALREATESVEARRSGGTIVPSTLTLSHRESAF